MTIWALRSKALRMAALSVITLLSSLTPHRCPGDRFASAMTSVRQYGTGLQGPIPGEAILLHGGQGGLNALPLLWRDETTQRLNERRMLCPGQNVLPPVGFEDASMQSLLLRLTQGAPTRAGTIVGIGLSLGLEDAVDGPHQLDKFIDALISLRGR